MTASARLTSGLRFGTAGGTTTSKKRYSPSLLDSDGIRSNLVFKCPPPTKCSFRPIIKFKNYFPDFFGVEHGGSQLEQSVSFVSFTRYTYYKGDLKHPVNAIYFQMEAYLFSVPYIIKLWIAE